jgi:hypothetical protein
MVGRSQAKVDECFRTCYRAGSTDAQLRLERLVFGSDYGADGWTTIEQADELARRLELRTAQNWRYDSCPPQR